MARRKHRPFDPEDTGDPTWEHASTQLISLTELTQGWVDSVGGLPITLHAQLLGVHLLHDLETHCVPTPYIYPTQDGGVQFEWDIPGRAVSAEIVPQGDRVHLQSTHTTTGAFEATETTTDEEGFQEALLWLLEQT